MQVRAIFEAAADETLKGVHAKPEVMIPLIGIVEEYKFVAGRVHAIAAEVSKKSGVKIRYKVGTMMEIPRACLVADKVAAASKIARVCMS